MDTALIGLMDRLAGFGPWFFFAGFVLLLYRRELWTMITASRDHLGPMMAETNRLFAENLKHFEQATQGIQAVHDELTKQTHLLNQVVTELVRNKH